MEDWEDVKIVDIDTDLLPAFLEERVEAVCRKMKIPKITSTAIVLTGFASLINRKASIDKLHPGIFTVVVGPSGSGKTPSVDFGTLGCDCLQNCQHNGEPEYDNFGLYALLRETTNLGAFWKSKTKKPFEVVAEKLQEGRCVIDEMNPYFVAEQKRRAMVRNFWEEQEAIMVPVLDVDELPTLEELGENEYDSVAASLSKRYYIGSFSTKSKKSPLTKSIALALLIGDAIESHCSGGRDLDSRLRMKMEYAEMLTSDFKEQTKNILQGEWDKARA